MSFKKFSQAQDTPTTGKPEDKSKATPATDQPASQPGKTPDKGGAETKS